MPCIGLTCDANGSAVTLEQCLACARQGALPGCSQTAPVITGLWHGLRPAGFGLTITTLLGCPRQARLQSTEPYRLKPAEAWWAYRGQLMHGVCAAYATDDAHALAEQRFSMFINGVEISGQPDLVLTDRRHLVDYKTTRAVPGPWRTWACPTTEVVIREGAFALRTKWLDCPACNERHVTANIESLGPPRALPRHVAQVSLYRLLLWENGVEVDTAEVVYMDMRQQLRVPVVLLSLAEAQILLKQRLAAHTQTALPRPLTHEAEVWQCDYCPVRAVCER